MNWVAAWVSFVEQSFLVWVPNPIGRRVRGDRCRTPSPREQPSLNRRAHSVCRSLGKATLVHPRAPVVPWRPSPFSPHRSALTEHSLLTPATMAVFFFKVQKVTSVGEDMEKFKCNIKCAASVENNTAVPQKVEHRITYDQAILLLSLSKELKAGTQILVCQYS